MKKTFLFFFTAFITSWSSINAQQPYDYIIMLDNGSSITDENYADMKRGAIKLMERLMACNERNRVTVVQYGTGEYGSTSGIYKPLIYIETEFTNAHFNVQDFKRRLDFGDHFNESLELVGEALDGNVNADVISLQKTLHPVHPLKVVVFTDAERNTGLLDGSYLVNYANTTFNDPDAFRNVMRFKINRQAQFTMIHANTNSFAVEAAASIAGAGGSYSGPLEYNMSDPDTGQSRLYYNRPNGFFVGHMEIDYWKQMAETICDSNTLATFGFYYEPGCINQLSNIGGYLNLPPGAIVQDIRAELMNLATGETYKVPFNPTYGPNNYFSNQFQLSDFADLVNAGATGEFKFKLTLFYSQNGYNFRTVSWNHYPFFDYDITTTCPVNRVAKSAEKEKIFKLTPNPTAGLFKVILNKEIQSGKLEIRDVSGNVVYHKILRGVKEVEADLSTQKQGVYIVNITTDKNEIYSEKIIRK
ncbi:MAG: T9SS type A sorting domain-containing protein [Chryseobacterium sp.]|jgi:hypothetical protein|uniref:T9SS type A sorting domain-containing protein n=1 Tax=Chryseobacterium sp. TaxID=1871047 RepID=UPI00283881F4|nr:T9SS type A sorting domain-containing protein [Chryseobacterium sp.]MDR2238424.1 T9SS type A sorting domain-containing protein [Chryseobacterium sp.]